MSEIIDTPNITELKDYTQRLLKLIEDPHPGLSSWVIAYGEIILKITEIIDREYE